ncbi:MAG: hydrogen gas-evolving membrane-bound hydrogenase subunit E [Rubrimonas sp.]|uniref:hydrogen gas-evolving membrane-bound hydrogenase subunit E n=1 Tax=Rubrimonas sp. TaxID=2036015 RepID=UPI002FDCDA0B
MAEGAAEARGGVLRYAPALLSALAAWWFLGQAQIVAETGPIGWSTPWIPSMGIEIAFLIDGLGGAFALLVTGIGALVLLYTAEYFRHHRQRNQLLLLLVLFELSMLGLVLADDALTLFVFWEGTTVTSFLLIGFDHEKADARAKATQALIVTGLGGLALLAGLLLLGSQAGTFRLSEMAQHADAIRDGGFYLPIFLLVILGCFTKSAQFPFHFWLPNAMAAPTPVSAYLHSATMVKAGVYLLARLSPTLGDAAIWDWTLTLIGGLTMVLSSVWALRQDDLKLALAHTTVMGLGTLTLLLGLGGETGATAFAAFLIVHALYKAALFLVIGVLDKKAGSRMAPLLSGLGRAMPITFAAAALAGASMAGLAPLFGFIGKELIYEGALHAGFVGVIVALAALAANAMMIAIAGGAGLAPFIGPLRSPKAEPAEGHWAMLAGPVVLAGLGLLFGLAPKIAETLLVGPTAASVMGAPVEVHLYLWHGLNLPLMLSLATFALGIWLYLKRETLRARLTAFDAAGRAPSCETGYDRAVAGLLGGGARLTRAVQTGLLTDYFRVGVIVLAAMLGAALVLGGGAPIPTPEGSPPMLLAASALIAVATLTLPFTERRLLMITALGIVGVGVALLFAIFSAIDVAITQLMVETLVVVILAVALLKLPRVEFRTTAAARRRNRVNAAAAAALGLTVTLALAAAVSQPLDKSVTAYFENASATLAYGRNIVNVILVDFRALDTMGEIAVVAIAGLAALALLAARVRPLEDRDE